MSFGILTVIYFIYHLRVTALRYIHSIFVVPFSHYDCYRFRFYTSCPNVRFLSYFIFLWIPDTPVFCSFSFSAHFLWGYSYLACLLTHLMLLVTNIFSTFSWHYRFFLLIGDFSCKLVLFQSFSPQYEDFCCLLKQKSMFLCKWSLSYFSFIFFF